MYRLAVLMMVLFQQATAHDNIPVTGSKIKSRDAELILAHHNKVRKEKKVPPLSWSKSLSAYAQEWADHLAKENNCTIRHRDFCGENGKVYGENIFWGSSAKMYPPAEASYSWYEEKRNYKYRRISSSGNNGSGHYTQMIWKNTREIGVGVAVCPNGAVIVVANYYPAGNMVSEYPY